MKHSPDVYDRIAKTRRTRLDSLVAQMHGDYQRGDSFTQLGRTYGRDRRGIQELFAKRGLAIRAITRKPVARTATGSFAAAVPLTPAKIEALIASATKLAVPAALKLEWRKWSMEQRGEFIARLRARLNLPGERLTTPFSANVEPYDYTSPRAWEIAAVMNAGRDSRSAAIKLDLRSQGVIWRDRLWFWSSKAGYVSGPWTAAHGRPCLHHTIWAEANGRPVPPHHAVRHRDGNRNNLDPANLVLLTKNDVCRENHAAALQRKSREQTAHLLHRSQQPASAHDLAHRLLTASR